jgi:hypothetical protein
MAFENNPTHFSAYHRLTLGWIPDKFWIKLHNFYQDGASARPVDGILTLIPIEEGNLIRPQYALISHRIRQELLY